MRRSEQDALMYSYKPQTRQAKFVFKEQRSEYTGWPKAMFVFNIFGLLLGAALTAFGFYVATKGYGPDTLSYLATGLGIYVLIISVMGLVGSYQSLRDSTYLKAGITDELLIIKIYFCVVMLVTLLLAVSSVFCICFTSIFDRFVDTEWGYVQKVLPGMTKDEAHSFLEAQMFNLGLVAAITAVIMIAGLISSGNILETNIIRSCLLSFTSLTTTIGCMLVAGISGYSLFTCSNPHLALKLVFAFSCALTLFASLGIIISLTGPTETSARILAVYATVAFILSIIFISVAVAGSTYHTEAASAIQSHWSQVKPSLPPQIASYPAASIKPFASRFVRVSAVSCAFLGLTTLISTIAAIAVRKLHLDAYGYRFGERNSCCGF